MLAEDIGSDDARYEFSGSDDGSQVLFCESGMEKEFPQALRKTDCHKEPFYQDIPLICVCVIFTHVKNTFVMI